MLQEKASSESELQVLDNVQDQRHMALHLRSNIFQQQIWSRVPLNANVEKVLLKKSFKVNTCWSFHFFMRRFFLLKSSLVRTTIWKMTKSLNSCCPCVMYPDNPDHRYQPFNGRHELITKLKTSGQNTKKRLRSSWSWGRRQQQIYDKEWSPWSGSSANTMKIENWKSR